MFGPLLAIGMIAWMPDIVSSALAGPAHGLGEDGLLAMFYVLGPCMLLAGLPAWWVLGAYLRLTAKLQNQDRLGGGDPAQGAGLEQGQRKEEIMTLERDAGRGSARTGLAAGRHEHAAGACMLLAIGLQESRFASAADRRPGARLQFERGTRTSRGGGVYLHHATKDRLGLCGP